MTALEQHAEEVAKDVAPDRQGPMEIVMLIMTIFQTVIQNCPLPTSAVREAFKRPSLGQRAALLKTSIENCRCCNQTHLAFPIYRSMLARASNLADVDATTLIDEARSDQNLLV